MCLHYGGTPSFKTIFAGLLGWYGEEKKDPLPPPKEFHLKEDLNLTEGLNPNKSGPSC